MLMKLIKDIGIFENVISDNVCNDLIEYYEKLTNLNRQFLHAKTIGFIHPITGKELEFTSNLPQDLDNILKMLRNS